MNKYAPIFLLAFFTFSVNAQDVASFFAKTDTFLKTYVEERRSRVTSKSIPIQLNSMTFSIKLRPCLLLGRILPIKRFGLMPII